MSGEGVYSPSTNQCNRLYDRCLRSGPIEGNSRKAERHAKYILTLIHRRFLCAEQRKFYSSP